MLGDERTAATIMLVHGAWHGSWCWEPVARASCTPTGIATAAVDNPSVTHARAPTSRADGDNLRAALDAIDGPVVLVGHSYGGAVITDAGAHPNVERLVYLTAFALDAGESVMQNDAHGRRGHRSSARRCSSTATSSTVDPARVVEFFFHDCTPAVAERGRSRDCARCRWRR